MIRDKYDLSHAEQAAHESKYGSFNDAPPNWREVSGERIVTTSLLATYTPTLHEYRQILPAPGSTEPMLPVHLSYFHDGSGVGMNVDRRTGIRWFMFERCKHDMRDIGVSVGGLRTFGCVNPGCGYTSAVDSSD